MLFTYGDVVRRARAYLDDQDAQVYTDAFLLENVNGALNTISSALVTNSVRSTLYRTPVPILIPAGAVKLDRLRDPVEVMNLKSSSDIFSAGPGSWAHTRIPTTTTGKADPEGGTGASEWSFPSPIGVGVDDDAITTSGTLYTAGSSNNFVGGGIWLRSTTMYPLTVALQVGYGGMTVVGDTKYFNITNTWKRIHHNAGPFSVSTTTSPAFRIIFDTMQPSESARKIEVWRAFQTDKSFDMLPDIKTMNLPVVASINALPTNYIAAQQLWEKGISDADYQYQPMYGPTTIPTVVLGKFLRWWDTREGEINFLGSTDDRLVRLDYWGDIGSFQRNTTVDASQAFPMADVSAFEAACALVAYLATRGKGALDQSSVFASLTPDGIGGAAGFHITNLINSQIKMKQSVAQRRQPAFGVRYPGATDRLLGGQ